jgi:hypothetical protein
MKLAIIESPYAGEVEANLRYARLCMAHSLSLNEAPLASHLLYTQPGILDDSDAQERAQGIAAGLAWAHFADVHAFYLDRGWSRGMLAAHKWCLRQHSICDYRSIYNRPVGPPDPTLLDAKVSQ